MPTNRDHHLRALAVVLAATLSILAACAPKSPEERVAALRARYTAQLNGFYEQKPAEPETTSEGMEADAEAMEAEAVGEGEMEETAGEEAMEMAGPSTSDILLDILIQHDANERLDGLTVDITQVDPSENPKASWKVWIDTSKIAKATHHQVSHVLEDVEYEEGDGFFVEVRSPVPPAERGEYREFASAGG